MLLFLNFLNHTWKNQFLEVLNVFCLSYDAGKQKRPSMGPSSFIFLRPYQGEIIIGPGPIGPFL